MGVRFRAMQMVLALVVLALAVGAIHYARALHQASTYNAALTANEPDAIAWDARPDLLQIKAYGLLQAGRIDEAITAYRRLEEVAPDEQQAEVLYNLGATHFALARELYDQPRTNVAPVIQQSRIAFMRALRSDSTLYPAKYNLEYIGLPRVDAPGETEGATDDVTDPEQGGTHRWQLMQDYPEGMP